MENFKTKYNTAEQYKPSINYNSGSTKTQEAPKKTQWLSPSENSAVFKITNRNLFGSKLKNPKFDPQKNQLGKFCN